MANEARITRRWPDGDSLYITIVAESAYPDALDEARSVAIRAYAEALDVTITSNLAWSDDEGDGDTV